VWEETAAKHVSLKAQLSAVAAVATRWRRLELASWRGLLVRVAARHAAGARRSWFHLYALLTGQHQADGDAAASDAAGGGAAGGAAAPAEAAAGEAPADARDVAYRRTASLLEAFLQTSTSGEFAARLGLLRAFAAQMAVAAAAGAGAPGGAPAPGGGADPAALAAALRNTIAYYSQFAPAVDAALAGGLAPLAKELRDFVALAKWEDRGYYAMKVSTEKAARQLHRLSRRAEGFLAQPAAGVLAAASQALGLAQLAPPARGGAAKAAAAATAAAAAAQAQDQAQAGDGGDAGAGGAPAAAAPAAGGGEAAFAGAGELSREDLGAAAGARSAEAVAAAAAVVGKRAGRGRRRGRRGAAGAPAVDVGDMELGEALEVVEEEDPAAWRAYAGAVLGAEGAAAVATAAAAPVVGGKYAGRLPQLAARMARVLEPPSPPALPAAGAAAGAAADGGGDEDGAAPAAPAARIDDLAATAAARALALRGDVSKGARARKKKALTDLLKALRAAGVSRRVADVPASERAVAAWFRQAPPDTAPLLEGVACGGGAAAPALGTARGALSAACWAKADVYYFRSIARVQRLQAAVAAPHKDLAAHEVAAAARGAEHLLYLLRRQRAALGAAAASAARLEAAAGWATAAAGGGAGGAAGGEATIAPPPLPPQAWARGAIGAQARLLEGLSHTLDGQARLLGALAGVEPEARAKAALASAAGRAGRYAARAGAAKAALEAEAARLRGCPVVDAPALAVVRANYAAAAELAADADAARAEVALREAGGDGDGDEGEAAPPPGWDLVCACLAHAAHEGGAFAEAEARLAVAAAAAAGAGSGAPADNARTAELEATFAARLDATVSDALLWAQAAAALAEGQDQEAGGDLVSWTVGAEAAARPDRAAATAEGVGKLLSVLAAACDAAWAGDGGAAATAARMAGALRSLRPLLLLQLGALRGRGAGLLPLHKATGKLAYVCSSLFCTLVQEGFCMPEGEGVEGDAAGEGGEWKEAEGTGMGEGTGAKDVSDQLQVKGGGRVGGGRSAHCGCRRLAGPRGRRPPPPTPD
jgi:midasin